MPEQLLDPRAAIVGGDYDTPADIAAREDIIAGMKMVFGDLDDPDSEISILIKKERGQVLNPEFGNKPKVYYLFPR